MQDGHFLLSAWGPAEQIFLNLLILPLTSSTAWWASLSWLGLQAMSWSPLCLIRETRTVLVGEDTPVVVESTMKILSGERRKMAQKKCKDKETGPL